DAKQDLIRAGGDPQARIQQLVDAHEASAHNTQKVLATFSSTPEQRGLIHRFGQWSGYREKERQLLQAKAAAEALVAKLRRRLWPAIVGALFPDTRSIDRNGESGRAVRAWTRTWPELFACCARWPRGRPPVAECVPGDHRRRESNLAWRRQL